MGYPIVGPDSEPETSKSGESESSSEMTLEDSLRRLRLKHYQQESLAWAPQSEESEPSAPSSDTIEGEPGAEETSTAAAELTGAEPPSDDVDAFQPTETASAKQKAFADHAIRQATIVLEHIAANAKEQTRQLLGQVAAAAMQQTNRVLERLVEDAAEHTSRVMEKLTASAASQVSQTLEKFAAEETAPHLNEAVEGLSGEVRRVGRELFKTARAAERNQEIFDSAIAELQRLTQRVEQVPAQLHSSESIIEVKTALCREMLGVADSLEASLVAAQKRMEQLQARIGSAQIEVSIDSAGRAPATSTQLFRRWGSWRERFRQWALRPPSPQSERVGGAAAARDVLDEAMATLSQWLEGQQLIYERLQTILQGAGVRQIESAGQAFDPSRHRAVSTESRVDVPAGTIVGEERRGYTLDGRVLRYAEVIVAKNEQDSRN